VTTRIYSHTDLLAIEEIIEQSTQPNLKQIFKNSKSQLKDDGSIITDADLAIQEDMAAALLQQFPQVQMLSEEITEQEQMAAIASGKDYWCLDPLDGTTNFHATVPLFSTSLALISNHQVVLGVVYDPVRREFFSALQNQGVWVNQEKLERPQQPTMLNQSIAFVDFKRLQRADRLRLADQAPYKSQRNIGTCALEWAWLAAGRVQLLIHGCEKLWDYAAGNLLLLESGGISETHEGESVFIESLETRSVLAATNAELFRQWSEWFRGS